MKIDIMAILIIIAVVSRLLIMGFDRTYNSVLDTITGKIRSELIERYKLTDSQIRYKISSGEEIYAENPSMGIFVKLFYREGNANIYDLVRGKLDTYQSEECTFIDEIVELANKRLSDKGLCIYNMNAYDVMVREGYKLC